MIFVALTQLAQHRIVTLMKMTHKAYSALQAREVQHDFMRAFSCCAATLMMALLLVLLPSQCLADDQPFPSESGSTVNIPTPLEHSNGLSADDISSEKVKQFAEAYIQVLGLVDQRAEELRRAETELESIEIQRELEAEAIAHIEEAGLTWQEYVQLLSLANTDPELSERIASQIQESSE